MKPAIESHNIVRQYLREGRPRQDLLFKRNNTPDSERKTPAAEIKNRRKSVSPNTKTVTAKIQVFIRKIIGIRLDFLVKDRSAKLIDLRVEDIIINAPPRAFLASPVVSICCNVYRLAKIDTPLEHIQKYTARVFICIIKMQIEKIKSSPI